MGGSTAHAQSAGAEALFRDGRALIKAGNLQAGCDKLGASEKLESSVGTLLNLGDCREKLGQTAAAWAAFRKAESMAKRAGDDTKRQAEARKRAEKLEPVLSNLVIQIGPSIKTTEGLVIRRDGEALDTAVLNTAVPVDPGSHTIVAEAPGFKPFKTEVSIGKGGKRYVVIPTLEALPAPVAPAPVVVTPPAPSPSVVIDREPAAPAATVIVHDTWSGTRKAAVVVGLLGAAAVGGGVYFGLRSDDEQSRSDAICPQTVCADAEGLRLNDDAQSSAMKANIFLIGGGAAVAVATVMWFVGKPEERTVIAPSIGNGQLGAALVGRF
jgi:serine/threonine-protein kinase